MGLAQERGAEICIWDFEEKPLPIVGAEGSWQDPTVKEFQELASSMDGYILSTPEYHGSYSSLMKQQLDWVYSSHVGKRAFALMATLGGVSSSNALNHLRIVTRWLHGYCIPEQLAVPHAKNAFDEGGEFTDPELDGRLTRMVSSLLETATSLRDRRGSD